MFFDSWCGGGVVEIPRPKLFFEENSTSLPPLLHLQRCCDIAGRSVVEQHSVTLRKRAADRRFFNLGGVDGTEYDI